MNSDLPIRRLRILLAVGNMPEAERWLDEFADAGYDLVWQPRAEEAAEELRHSQFDCLIADESLTPGGLEGLQLAETCRGLNLVRPGRKAIQPFILLPTWDSPRADQVREAGGFPVAKSSADQIPGLIKVFSGTITASLTLRPLLLGIHLFSGAAPAADCRNCRWFGTQVLYWPPGEIFTFEGTDDAIFNALLRHQEGLSDQEIVATIRKEEFLSRLLGDRVLVPSAIKMRASRIRNNLTTMMTHVHAPYDGRLFLPYIKRGYSRYRLAGNWQLVHEPDNENAIPEWVWRRMESYLAGRRRRS